MGHLTKRKHQSMSAVTLLLIKEKIYFSGYLHKFKKQDKENRCCTLLSLPTQVHKKKKLLLLTLPSHSTEGSSLVSSPYISINLCHLFYAGMQHLSPPMTRPWPCERMRDQRSRIWEQSGLKSGTSRHRANTSTHTPPTHISLHARLEKSHTTPCS